MALAPNTEIGKLTFTPKDTNITHYLIRVQQGGTSFSNDGVISLVLMSGFERTIPANTLVAKADGTVTISVLWRDVLALVSIPENLSKSAEIILHSVDSANNYEGKSVTVDKLADIAGGGVEEGGEGQNFDLDT